jgi:hypothetical protein
MMQLRERLTIGERTDKNVAKLDYLLHVARGLRLIEQKEERIVVGPNFTEWVELGLTVQAQRVFSLWLDDFLGKKGHFTFIPGWEASECHALFRGIVEHLGIASPGKWYSLDSLIRCIPADSMPVSSLLIPERRAISLEDKQSDVAARELADSVAKLFHWMSALSLSIDDAGDTIAFQVTPLGAWVYGCDGAAAPAMDNARLSIDESLDVTVSEPDIVAWSQLIKYAITTSLGETSVHRLTKRKVQQTVFAGTDYVGFLNFLYERSDGNIPQRVADTIEDWAQSIKPVNVTSLTVLEVEDEEILDEILASPKYAQWLGRRIGPTTVVVNEDAEMSKLMREMRTDGYFPQLDR